MFIVEWMFDKMGYTKKIDWTSSSLLWETVNVDPKESKVKIRKPVKKVATKRTSKKSSRTKKD